MNIFTLPLKLGDTIRINMPDEHFICIFKNLTRRPGTYHLVLSEVYNPNKVLTKDGKSLDFIRFDTWEEHINDTYNFDIEYVYFNDQLNFELHSDEVTLILKIRELIEDDIRSSD